MQTRGTICGNEYELNVPSVREKKEMVGEGREKSTKLENLTFISACIRVK